jgi:hypothetical protein
VIINLICQIGECYSNLLQLGNSLSNLDKIQLEEALDSLRSKFRDLLPSNERLAAFLQAEETFALAEWLEMYEDTPIDIAMERDLIWPVP